MLHVDLDQFIAAVEVLRHPELAGKPVIVGGRGDPTERAVVSTASYEAREFGVGSGMPLRIAARKAPDAVILPVDAEAYTAASDEVMATLRAQPGATVQVLGWDEAFVGVQTDDPRRTRGSCSRPCSSAPGCTAASASATRWCGRRSRPGSASRAGCSASRPRTGWTVMGDRPTIDLWGVGTKISRRLAALGITTVAELAAADPASLMAEFGPRMGPWYILLGRGEGATRRRRHAVGGARAQPGDDLPAGPHRARPGRGGGAGAGRPGARGRRGRGPAGRRADPEGALRAVHHEDLHEEGGRDLRPRGRAGRVLELVARIEPDRPIRLLGLRAEMPMPEDAREGHTPTRGGW